MWIIAFFGMATIYAEATLALQTRKIDKDGTIGHYLLRDRGQTLHPAQEDEPADDHQHHAHDPAGDAESGGEGGADGVGLDHAAHEAQGQRAASRTPA